MSSFLTDYYHYNSGNECPPQFHLWSALSVLAVTSGRRVHFTLGGADGYEQLIIYPDMYICLVGPQGLRKSIAKDIARDLISQEFPDYPLSYSVETREGIWNYLGSDDAMRFFTNEKGEPIEYRPMFLGINELKNFLSVNPYAMVDFLIDIYGRPEFKNRTKNKGIDIITNPNINILACATTEYTIGQLKDGLLAGLARRMVFVNVDKYERNPHPTIPPGGREAWSRVRGHLQRVANTVGPFQWRNAEDREFYDKWYLGMVFPSDKLMAGFYNSKHIQVLKVTMLLALAQYEIELTLTKERLSDAIEIVNNIEPGMEKLFASSGRNELVGPMNRILELLESVGGMYPEKRLQADMDKDLEPQQQYALLRHLDSTDRIRIREITDAKGVKRRFVMTAAKYRELKTNGELKE